MGSLWAPGETPSPMEDAEYERMAEAESRSWWFKARRRILSDAVGRLELPASPRIADLGCGTGGNLPMLAGHGYVTGVEASPKAAGMARQSTGLAVVTAEAHATKLPDASFQLVTMFDVLEHLDEEGPALAEVARLLVPGGAFLFTVPALMLLWSGHDEALHHRRRYRRGQLRAVVAAAGLEVDWITYYNASLFPPVAAIRVARRLVGGGKRSADVGEMSGWTARLLEGLFAAERHVVGRVPLPFGVSLIGVARKP
jgi:SAM-dependent methyltransferase